MREQLAHGVLPLIYNFSKRYTCFPGLTIPRRMPPIPRTFARPDFLR
jgi:hypothetical protein